MMIVNNVIGAREGGEGFFRCPDDPDPPWWKTAAARLIKGLQEVFPEQKPIDRTWINTWEDGRASSTR